MGFDYRIYDNHTKLEQWKDENDNYYPIFKSFDIIDAFMLDTMSSGRMLTDKREVGVDRSYLKFNDEKINLDKFTMQDSDRKSKFLTTRSERVNPSEYGFKNQK